MNLFYSRIEKLFFILASLFCLSFYLYYSNYSALLYPFFDHLESYILIEKFTLNQMTFKDLIAFHNEHLPVISRIIYLILSNMGLNMRSQFFVLNIVFITILITFIVAFIRFNESRKLNFFAYLIISVLILNPSGSTNWWWSFMLELLLATLFSALAFVAYSSDARFRTLYAAIFAIFAIFSQAMGILVAPVILCLSFYQNIVTGKKNVPNFIFWFVFSAISCYLYLKNVNFTSSQHPSILTLICYVAVFIGKVFVSIFHPINKSMWGGSSKFIPQLISGSCFILLSCYLILLNFQKCSSKDKLFNLSVLLIIFSLSVAFVTGWGRAAMPGEGIAHANSQPTYLVASFFYIGILGLLLRAKLNFSVVTKLIPIRFIYIIFIFSFIIVWIKSIHIFTEARHFNETLRDVYRNPEISQNINLIYPNVQVARKVILYFCSQSKCD